MKKLLLTAMLSSALFTSLGASAMPQSDKAKFPLFRQLDLSLEQKQAIREIMQTVREDNSIYSAEKSEIKTQLESLFALDSWDEALAKDIVSAQSDARLQPSLNLAKAKHQAFQLLDEAQRAKLTSKAENTKSKKYAKAKKRKLAKKLKLSTEQIGAYKGIMTTQKNSLLAFKDEVAAHKSAELALLMASEFDEEAWLSLQNDFTATSNSIQLIKLQSRFAFRQLLDEEQLAKLDSLKSKKRDRKRA
ncbi:Spy/CpxP family protein refolding chaperone [Agaribacter flavus]|uniref:Spy/CpxP family protein refolding chaperone n=1 Tax=Agaribacter flavus TaxID=1902781 RepID=A0ABV7FRP7_9ALTE